MAWIESHQSIEKHPKVIQLGRSMEWSLDETIGRLHRFWWWCLEYAPTGDLRSVDPVMMANGIGLMGDFADRFATSMLRVHLICPLPPSRARRRTRPDMTNLVMFRIHDWIEHAGRYLRDSKFKRSPDKYAEVVALYKISCRPTVSRLSADNPQTVRRLSAVPDLTRPNLTNPSVSPLRGEADEGGKLTVGTGRIVGCDMPPEVRQRLGRLLSTPEASAEGSDALSQRETELTESESGV